LNLEFSSLLILSIFFSLQLVFSIRNRRCVNIYSLLNSPYQLLHQFITVHARSVVSLKLHSCR